MLTELLRGYHIEQPWISQIGIPSADLEGKLATDPGFLQSRPRETSSPVS